MEKVDTEQLNTYVQQLKDDGKEVSAAYSEIDIVREIDFLKEKFPDDQKLHEIKLEYELLRIRFK